MASLLQGTLYEAQCPAPAPSKDFHHFIVTQKEVILRSWKISVRAEERKALPKEVKKTHSEFLLEEEMQKQIKKIFGKDTADYVLNLCRGHCDFLVRIPYNLKIRILSFLDANDIKHLSDTCKTFQKLCSSDEFWEKIKSKPEKQSSAVHRSGFSVSMKKYNQKTEGPLWMQRRRSTFF
ncbi:F-box only protein 36-like [Spea bombifrons]|uniref:F-box only protein 36-like n=1 Tax=Spea bombifrons TaxID=233779 RepID=UPI002349F14E|nr:F-box only protein 36-like [Spea bombifrons]